MQNFSLLACLEVAEKVVVVGWSRPSLGLSFSQADQLKLKLPQQNSGIVDVEAVLGNTIYCIDSTKDLLSLQP